MKCGPDECPIRLFSDLTPAEQRAERKHIAKKMMDQGFTEQQIAKQLGVSQSTIRDDLRGLVVSTKPPRPKGGRPKGSIKPRVQRQPKAIEREEKVAALHDEGLSAAQIGAAVGLGRRAVHQALEHVEIKRSALADPEITPDMLSATAREKLAAAIRQHQHKLDALFEKRVHDGICSRMDEIILPYWKKQIEQAKDLFNRRKGAMPKDTFNAIRRALHPDSRHSISDRKLAEAFDAFMSLEKYLLDEKDSPTTFGDLPSSAAEWDKMRARRKAGVKIRAVV